ncbi:MAG TPA: CAP domain-containing protein, partial [Anaerolineaceae bacterium]
MRALPRILILSIVLALLASPNPWPAAAAGSSPSEVIDAVNALRASHGLVPLRVNSQLMSSAQGQSNYQASINTVTHTGPGGTRPYDRALAAGYGGGATFFISENIYGGTNASAQLAVQAWTGDTPHWDTMMTAASTDIGAGVASSGDFVYYTIDVAYTSGHANPAPAVTSAPPGSTALTGDTPIPIFPLMTSTPAGDGSIVHVVQYGQTLITIASAYGVKLTDLRSLNHLTSDNIYVGDKLIIQLGA